MSDEQAAAILQEVRELRAAVDELRGAAASGRSSNGLLTKQQVAKVIGGRCAGGCSVRKVERLVKAGKLKKVPNLGARTTRFRPADVNRFLADKETQPGRRRL